MKSIFFILLILINYTYASNKYIDIYRKEGIEGLQKLIDKTLTQKSYWFDHLKNIDVSNGYFESIHYLLKCDKANKTLNIFDIAQNKNINIFDSNILIGKNNGDKHNEGDLKTPIGVYNFKQKLTKLEPFYGPMAFVTSYPNQFDKGLGKTGSGIWIHGKPIDNKRKPYTRGCIVLDNKNLLQLNKIMNYRNAILVIEQNNTISTKEQLATILSELFLWKKAWTNSNLDKYLSFYSKNFKKSNKMNFTQFAKYKKRVFAKNEKKTIVFKNINIIPYPNNLKKTMFEVTFIEKYKSNSFRFFGKKRIYLELIDNKIKILNER